MDQAVSPPARRPRPKAMTLTDAAAARVKDIMAKQPAPVAALRIGVRNGGCAGMEYTMEWAAERGRFDELVEDKGVTLLIDARAVMFLLGSEMDYKADKLKAGFVFHNPNQVSACGCGESVKLEAAKDA